MSLSGGLSTLSRGFRKIGGKFRMGPTLSTTSEHEPTGTSNSPSMSFSEEQDDSDNEEEEACYDQVNGQLGMSLVLDVSL